MNPLRERIATSAVFLSNGLGIGAWAAAIPGVKERLQLSEAHLGIALLAFAAGAIVAMPLAGRIAPRFGVTRLTLLVALAFALLLIGPALAPNYIALLLLLFALGAANGVTDVLMNAHASDVETATGKPIMSSFHAMWSLGGLSGATIGGLIAHAGLPTLAGLGLPALAAAALVIGAGLIGMRPVPHEAEHAAPHFALPERALLVLGGVAFLCMVTEGAVADWSAVYLRSYAGVDAGTAASGYAAYALAMASCRFVGDYFVRRLGPSTTMLVGGGTAALGFAVVLGFPGIVTGWIGFALIGLGVANIVPVLFSAAARKGRHPAAGVAMTATAGYAGFLVGPPIIGFCAELVGLRVALMLLLFATIAVALTGQRAVRTPAAKN